MPTRKQALVSKPPAMRLLQIEVTSAFFKVLKNYCTDGETTLRAFCTSVLAGEIGVSPVTGKPLPKAKGERNA